ncbi:MAG: glycerophosphodiester phosphodiesterase family protein [Balneolaceae bacterium]|nr:glycerophosphodiester phosphodiesterase family protein [Balneolaceae bacterium]
MRFLIAVFFSIFLMTCTNNQPTQTFDLQGHRGARGLMPENTIPAFLKAVDLGVDTIELDVVVTGDERILVSHEPWFSHNISTKPDGSPVTEEEEMEYNIYEMTYEETQQFDVGKKGHPSFPNQERMEAKKPLLRDVIETVENYTDEQGLQDVKYNIETKSEPMRYGTYYPQPEKFAQLLNDLLMDLDEEFDMLDRVIIQSFDPATLVEFRKLNPDVSIAMLVSNRQTIQHYVNELGFVPEIWSPNYQLVSSRMIAEAHSLDMKVIPWTVNTTEEMNDLIEMGVDGIITDYPDSAMVLQ